jgi:hypothetical protein
MEEKIREFIYTLPLERQNILSCMHAIILEEDKTVSAEVGRMMGKEMIIYKGKGLMKYGLGSVKNYMTLHALPIYGSKTLFSKYKTLLEKANFQKGCINFDSQENMPLNILREMITDCSKIDLLKIREDYLMQKKTKVKSKG